MKRILQIITFTLVFAASLFFLAGQSLDYFVFKYRQSVIRKEIKKQIKNGVAEEDLFTFAVADINTDHVEWIKPGKEFRMNGTMYDIVRMEIIDGKSYYKCINDEQEGKLFAELDEMVNKRMNDDSTDDYLKNLLKNFVKMPIVVSSSNFLVGSPDKENTAYLFSVSKVYSQHNFPPPKSLI